MDKIPAKSYLNDTIILGFDGHIYKNNNSQEWIQLEHRYLGPVLEILYDARKDMHSNEIIDAVIKTDGYAWKISMNFLGSSNYGNISSMILACEIVEHYGYNPLDFFNLNLNLGEQEDIVYVLNQLKENEMLQKREFENPESTSVVISARGEIFIDSELHSEEKLIYDRGNYTLEDLKLSKGLKCYEHVKQFLTQTDTLTPEEEHHLKFHLTDLQDDDSGGLKKFYNYIDNETFENESYPRSILDLPTKNLPIKYQEYIHNQKFDKMVEKLHDLEKIKNLEEFICYQMENGKGLYNVTLEILNHLWPNNNANTLSNVDKSIVCGYVCYLLMKNQLCSSVDKFASWLS